MDEDFLTFCLKRTYRDSERFFSEPAVVLSFFRSLSPLGKSLVINEMKPLDELTYSELLNKSILFKEKGYNQNFIVELRRFCQVGYVQPFVEEKPGSSKYQKEAYSLKEIKDKWRNVQEAIVNQDKRKRHETYIKVLDSAELIRSSQSITEKGFKFLLSSTSIQINHFIISYVLHKESLFPLIEMIKFIFKLNLCIPTDIYSKSYASGERSSFNPMEEAILKDFHDFGLIQFITAETFRPTFLLSNFSFEKNMIDLDFKADILVETNFRLYAYTDSQFIFDLLSHFCDINYKLKNLIIATLSKESLTRAFKSGISSQQIIDFFNKNIDPEKIKKMITNTKTKFYNKSLEIETKKKLPFLRLFDEKTKEPTDSNEAEVTIPDNIIQQIKFWEDEQEITDEDFKNKQDGYFSD